MASNSEVDVNACVISDVLSNLGNSGVDPQVLMMLEQLWKKNLSNVPQDMIKLPPRNPNRVSRKAKKSVTSQLLAPNQSSDALQNPLSTRETGAIPKQRAVQDKHLKTNGIQVDFETSLNRPKTSSSKKKRLIKKLKIGAQLDGPADTSDSDLDNDDEDDDNDDDDDDDDDDDLIGSNDDDEGGEEEPLGSNDDISDEDPSDLFNTENVVVCQYDKITRARNKWKFHLKDGIMNLNGKDFVFFRATGEAEW